MGFFFFFYREKFGLVQNKIGKSPLQGNCSNGANIIQVSVMVMNQIITFLVFILMSGLVLDMPRDNSSVTAGARQDYLSISS